MTSDTTLRKTYSSSCTSNQPSFVILANSCKTWIEVVFFVQLNAGLEMHTKLYLFIQKRKYLIKYIKISQIHLSYLPPGDKLSPGTFFISTQYVANDKNFPCIILKIKCSFLKSNISVEISETVMDVMCHASKLVDWLIDWCLTSSEQFWDLHWVYMKMSRPLQWLC